MINTNCYRASHGVALQKAFEAKVLKGLKAQTMVNSKLEMALQLPALSFHYGFCMVVGCISENPSNLWVRKKVNLAIYIYI